MSFRAKKIGVYYKITGRDLSVSSDDGPALSPSEMDSLMGAVRMVEKEFEDRIGVLVRAYVVEVRNADSN